MERRGAQEEAFVLFDNAVQIAPDNVLVRYRRAKLLIGMKRYNVIDFECLFVFRSLTDVIAGGD